MSCRPIKKPSERLDRKLLQQKVQKWTLQRSNKKLFIADTSGLYYKNTTYDRDVLLITIMEVLQSRIYDASVVAPCIELTNYDANIVINDMTLGVHR